MHAPSLWVYELTSALGKTVHFGQVTAEEGERALGLAQRSGVRLAAPDDGLVRRALAWTLRLERGAACDGFRSALAEELGCDLWAADWRLARAVDVAWVRLVGAPG